MQPSIFQAVIAVMMYTASDLWEALMKLGIDTRNNITIPLWEEKHGCQTVRWNRGEDTAAYMKADKKGRIFVAQKFSAQIGWGISSKKKMIIIPGIIQLNVLKSNSKRGGWLIRTHVQTPVLARTLKFQFHGKWVGYWASDAMLEAGLMVRASNHKFSKAMLINDVISEHIVQSNINQLKEILGEKIIVPELNMDDVTALLSDKGDVEPY